MANLRGKYHTSPMVRQGFQLAFPEAAHLAGFLNRLVRWDGMSTFRIQTRGRILGAWAETPMGAIAFVAIPMQAPLENEIDRFVSAGRMRDLIGDLTGDRREHWDDHITLPDEMSPTIGLLEVPPSLGWISAEKLTCAALVDLVEAGIRDFHDQVSALPSKNPAIEDQLAKEIWSRQGVAGMPLSGLHAARQLGFLSHQDAKAEFATNQTWKRLITPAGQIFWRPQVKRAKLQLV